MTGIACTYTSSLTWIHPTVTANGQTPQAKNGVEYANPKHLSLFGPRLMKGFFAAFTRFDNRYAWVLQWDPEKEKVVEVRAYLDSAMVNQALKD